MTKRILAILLTLAMVLSLCSVNVFADETEYEIAVTLISNSKSVHGTSFAGPDIGWGSCAIDSGDKDWNNYVTAMKTEGARLVIKYKVTTAGNWFNWISGGIEGSIHAGGLANFTATLDGKDSNDLLAVGEHVIYQPAKDYIASFAAHTCEPGEWNNFNHKAGDVNFDMSTGLFFQSDGTAKLNITDCYVEVPKTDEPDEEPEFVEEVVYNMSKTQGQDFDGKELASGVTLSGDAMKNKISTNWVGGGSVFKDLRAALDTPDAQIKITTSKGAVKAITVQNEKEGTVTFELPAATDGVVCVSAADFLAKCGKAYDAEGWCNIMLEAEEGTVLNGFAVVIIKEVVKPEEKPAGRTFGYAIQLTHQLHGFLVNGKMIPMNHGSNGSTCPQCGQRLSDSSWVYTRPSGKTNLD